MTGEGAVVLFVCVVLVLGGECVGEGVILSTKATVFEQLGVVAGCVAHAAGALYARQAWAVWRSVAVPWDIWERPDTDTRS